MFTVLSLDVYVYSSEFGVYVYSTEFGVYGLCADYGGACLQC